MAIPRSVKELAREKLFPPKNPYTEDPVSWMTERGKAFTWSKQREILESVRDNRFTAVPACHGPGKSFTAGGAAVWWIDSHPPGDAMVVTTAPTDHQVKAILWKEIARRRRAADAMGRITLEAKWYFGERLVDEELVAFGRKPQDYNPEAFQGVHAKYILVIVDEATAVPKPLFDALETLMTNDYARMLAIGNPDDPTSYFETCCRPGSGWNVIPISAFITPNFTGERVPTDVAEQLVTPLWVEERKQKWGEGSPLYISKVLAKFPDISNDTLITPSMVREAQERSLPGIGLGNYGWDVARFGPDETVGYRNRDGVVRRCFSSHQLTTDITVDHIHFHLNRHLPHRVGAVIDEVGLGAGVVDELSRRGLNVHGFNGANTPFDTDVFANKRAECYWNLRELFVKGLIDLDPNDDVLAAQLCSIKWKVDRFGRIVIESKEDMKRRRLPSPDRADAVMMACSLSGPLVKPQQQIILPTVTGHLLEEIM